MNENQTKVFNYYNTHHIVDYKKNKNGYPDMRIQQNKITLKLILRNEILERNKKENLHNYKEDKEENYRHEIEALTDEEIHQIKQINSSTCVICHESLKNNYSMLPCEHMFCTTCIAEHSRNANNCPLCRKDYCSKPKKINRLSGPLLEGIFHESYNIKSYRILNEVEPSHLFKDAIVEEIGDFEIFIEKMRTIKKEEYNETFYEDYKRDMITQILKNIHELNVDLTKKIVHYYEEQI